MPHGVRREVEVHPPQPDDDGELGHDRAAHAQRERAPRPCGAADGDHGLAHGDEHEEPEAFGQVAGIEPHATQADWKAGAAKTAITPVKLM